MKRLLILLYIFATFTAAAAAAPPETRNAMLARGISSTEYGLNIQRGRVPDVSVIHKYGRNPDIDLGGGFEAIWNGGGDYTGHDPIVAEILETFSSSATDVGSVLSSGTATGGSDTQIIDTGATFATDTVAVGDVVVNDTQQDHGIVTAVAETTITVRRFEDGTTFAATDVYRVVTATSTGAPIVKLKKLLDGNFDNETSEYIVLNGVTGVDTTGTYIRHSQGKIHGGANEGAITTRQKTTVANVMMVLPIGYNSTMIAAYTVPAGKQALFVSWFAVNSKKISSFSSVRLMARSVGDVFMVLEEVTINSSGTSALVRSYSIPKNSIQPMTDIKIMADSDTNDNGVAAGFDLILVDLE